MSEKVLHNLTDDQYEELREGMAEINAIGAVLGQAVAEAAKISAAKEREFWKSVKRLVGGEKALTHITVDWVNRTIIEKE